MRHISFLGAAIAAFLSVSTQANAQGFFPPISLNPILSAGGTVIGPDGTYYLLVPASTSTPQARVTELVAIAATTTGNVQWVANINGEVGQVLPGVNDVYVVQTTTSGSGRSTTTTTSVLVFPTSSSGTASPGTPIAPTGNISNIQIKTVGNNDYLYIYSVSTMSSSSGGTTTFTTTQTLTIYTNGAKPETVTIP